MATYVRYDVKDIHGKVSPWRMQITDQDTPADVLTFANAVGAAAFGATKPSQGGFDHAVLEIYMPATPILPQTDSDIQQNWQTTLHLADGSFGSRMGIPAKNDLPALFATGAYPSANLTQAAWAALATAMFGGAVAVLDTATAAEVTEFAKALGSVRARKRPRVGGNR
jgi:hypothetical protein